MTFADPIPGITSLFLDSAPVIYYFEENSRYLTVVEPFFQMIDNGQWTGVTSPVTLAECLVHPLMLGQTQLQQTFFNFIANGDNTLFVQINEMIALQAAQLRARYNLSLTDALQIGVALFTNCEAFLTNDIMLKRVTELQILVLDEFVVSRNT